MLGVDSAATMLALAAKRCEGFQNASFETADAGSLPAADAGFDTALSVQGWST